MGFPKHGTTSAHALIKHSSPCMIKRRSKEPHFWTRFWLPECLVAKDGRIRRCHEKQVVERFLMFLRGGDRRGMQHVSNEKEMLAAGKCRPPFWIDGSTPTLWERKMEVRWRGRRRQAAVETLVVIQELTPHARFLGMVREWGLPLVRSSWWFFMGTRQGGNEYRANLQKHLREVKGAGAARSRCEALFNRDFERPRVNSWAGSCNLAAVTALFGPELLFLAEAAPFMACETDFFSWFAHGLAADLHIPPDRLKDYGSHCSPLDKPRKNKRTESAKEYDAITPEIEQLEQRLLAAAKLLLPLRNKTG